MIMYVISLFPFQILLLILIQLMQLSTVFCYRCNATDSRVSLNTYFANKSCSDIYLDNGVFYIEESKVTNYFEGTNFTKLIGKENSTIHCHYNAGLTFRNASNIVLQTVTFHNCGMKFNSTSADPDFPNTTLISKAALLFEYCHNVSLSFLTVENSGGVGVQIYNTIGDVNISHCNFVGNKLLSNESKSFSGGGGMYIEFSLCQPGTNSIGCKMTVARFTSEATYIIEYCKFIQNIGSTTDPERTAFIRAGNHTHFAFGRGGGLSIYLKGNASFNNFTISNIMFIKNTALFGAGMFIELQDTSNNNKFGISCSHFISNKVISQRLGYTGTSGGGAMLDFIIFNKDSGVLYNTVAFIDTTFKSNSAFTGGGFSFHSSRESGVVSPTNHLHFTRCHWYSNTARLGAAIDLSILHSSENGQLIKPVFGNCTFESNVVSGFNIDHKSDNYGISDPYSNNSIGGYWPGTGIMYLDRVTVDLSQRIFFFNNTGSAVAAIGAGINLYSNTILDFTNNRGSEGGALYLSGYSWISASPNVQVLFKNNLATSFGGAIYAQKSGEHDLVSNSNCFIRYSDNIKPPDEWENVKFSFIDNHALIKDGGDAIYTTTVVDCAWNGSFKAIDNATLRNVFLNWTNFEFNCTKGNCPRFIQTSARFFKRLNSSSLSVAPGQTFKFPFEVQNDFGQSTATIFSIFSGSEQVNIPNPVVKTDGSTLFKAKSTEKSFFLQFETVDSRKHVGYINVSVKHCPLGFYLNVTECICNTEKYDGISHCSSHSGELEIYVEPGYWAGEICGSLATYMCPLSYCKHDFSAVPLDNNNDATLCNKRTGRLCGNCLSGLGLEIGTLDCIKCNGPHFDAWAVYITTAYIPITTVFILLLILNMNLAVGPIHSFILFCQIFPAISMDNNHWGKYNNTLLIFNNVFSTIVNVLSLKFDLQFSTGYCLSPNMTVMDYYLLQYLAALYPLLIMLVILSIIRYCPGCIPIKYFWWSIRRCVMAIRRRTSMRQTVIHGFITFLLFTYASFVNVSFQILAYAAFDDECEHRPPLLVPIRNGTMDYFERDHLPYGLTALAFLLIFGILPPSLLVVYPIILSTIGYLGWDNTSTVRTLRKWIPLYKLKPVFDAFWSEFKPNCHMFAGFYFVYRFLAFAIFSFSPSVYQIYLWMSILFVTMLFLHALIQPYRKSAYNKADIVMFSIIIAINLFYAYSEYLRTRNVAEETKRTYLWVQTLLPLVPFICIIGYVVFKICKARKKGFIMILNPHIDEAEEVAYEALLNRMDDDGDHQDDNDE